MPRPRIHENDAARAAAYRLRHDTVTLTVQIPRELAEQFSEWLKFKNKTRAGVIADLIRNQVLRKR